MNHREREMTSKTVAIGAALAFGGVLLGMNFPIADAMWGGPYGLSAAGSTGGAGWRMNQRQGQVTSLTFKSPQCSPWGPAAAER